MVKRVYNFNPGPAALPLPVLKKAQEELVDYRGTGLSMLETSHRSKEFDAVMDETVALVRELMDVPDEYHILFMGGGASSQFYMVPSNIALPDRPMDYIDSGRWSAKAIPEAKRYGTVNVPASSAEDDYTYIPTEFELSEDAAYVHITSNNTVNGTQWQSYPDTGDIPLVADLSSDIMSRKMDIRDFGLVYAGAQKNLGPAGVTLVIVRDDLVKRATDDIPTMVKYQTHVEKRSMFNTPPTFPIYICKLALEYWKEFGGIDAIEKQNEKKADMLYSLVENSDGFYTPHARDDSRSMMNVTFNLPTEALEKECAAKAAEHDIIGVKGHRSVGGMRASLYNAVTVEATEALCQYLTEFMQEHR